MLQANYFVNHARTYLGTKFRHQGRTKFGLDCAGLIVKTCKDLGIDLIDTADYGRQPTGALVDYIKMNCNQIDEPRFGCLALMKFEKEPQHMGIITDVGFLHTYSLIERVTEHRLDDKWRSRIISYWWLNCVN